MLFDVLFILVPVLHSIVLVISSWITSYDKVGGSKQHALVIAWFLGVRNPRLLSWSSASGAAVKGLGTAGVSSEAQLGKDPLSSSCGCWEDSVP